MGFRFRRLIQIAPGVRLNLGLKSASASFGIRGLSHTVGTAGQRVTVGLPGTGLYWTKALRSGGPAALTAAVIMMLGLVIAAVALLGH